MDMGIDDNFRVGANIYGGIPDPGYYSVMLGTWGKTYLNAAICNVLCFDAKDEKVQTGSALWDSNSDGNERPVRQTFKRPFTKTPDVVVFITSFDSNNDRFVRIDVAASEIDKNGFTVNMRTWDG
ncbi:ATP synthase subunits region orf 7 [Colletotrichum higginsianum IMI 349063]|uniref:ATP synthase subunits region orf 7 n=1 Tax=Colletotrichum higginsianum (strain IMI 349063) TaxID=759273 RepID=A0A1B7XXU2_COLHI|nr:ATP synthase subunits region orf 7 [Colletotrichum higginsianum IMI 349063]OBR04570.1 ATP synthase subunits region orf 7 [Colletotrichum higginsianum IMI 349063]